MADVKQYREDIDKYGTTFPDKPLSAKGRRSSLISDIINSAYTEPPKILKHAVKEEFRKYVQFFDKLHPQFNNDEAHDVLKKYLVNSLRGEGKAYEKTALIEKRMNNVKGETISDARPCAYNMIADILEKIDVKKLYL